MAVAGFAKANEPLIRRQFDPPKKSSLRAWYNAATKLIAGAPKFDPTIEATTYVDEETISFEGHGWVLFIARKRRLP